jgi:23S rRNA pseudouridine1911/1915/1917 synthase
MKVSSRVPGRYHNMNLVAYLADRFTYLSAASWKKSIAAGRVWLNGKPVGLDAIVRRDDVISTFLPDIPDPEVRFDYRILYRDRWLLIVDKPAGVRVHSSGKYVRANLIFHLRHRHDPTFPTANLVNRLDAATSGVLLVALEKAALRALARQQEEGAIKSSYLAIVRGTPHPRSGTIDLALGPDPGNIVRGRQAVDEPPGTLPKARSARTDYETIAALISGDTLLRLYPQHGRTHQLRVHLAAIGHALRGDALYQMTDSQFLEHARSRQSFQGMMGHALHCHRVTLTHPITHATMTVTAPMPDTMRRLIAGTCPGIGR